MTKLYITSIQQLAGIFEDNAKDYDRILRGVTNASKRRELIAARDAWRQAASFTRRHELLKYLDPEAALRDYLHGDKIG